jgi:hypothetical protein
MAAPTQAWNDAAAATAALLPHQRRLRTAGVALLCLGCAMAVTSWAFVTAVLCLATGGLLLDNFGSWARACDRLVGRRTGCQAAGGGDPLCCAPLHLPALLVGALTFACLEAALAAVFLGIFGAYYRVLPLGAQPTHTSEYDATPGARAGRAYVSAALLATVLLPAAAVVPLALATRSVAALTRLAPGLFASPFAVMAAAEAAAAAAVAAGGGSGAGVLPLGRQGQQPSQPQLWRLVALAAPPQVLLYYGPPPAGAAGALAALTEPPPHMMVLSPPLPQQRPSTPVAYVGREGGGDAYVPVPPPTPPPTETTAGERACRDSASPGDKC